MKDSEFTFAVARIRANETKLLTAADLNGALAAKSLEETRRRLKDKGYDFSEGDGAALEKKRRETWELLESILPEPGLMDAVRIRADFHNLKVLLKALVAGATTDGRFAYPSVYDPEALRPLVFERKNDRLPPVLQHCDRSAYRILTKTRFAQLADSVIDRASMETSRALARQTGDPTLIRLTETQTALTDFRILYRCIRTEKADSFMLRAVSDCAFFTKQEAVAAAAEPDGLPALMRRTSFEKGAEALKNGPVAFEKYADDAVTELLRPAKTEIWGIAPLLGYWFAVNTELTNLRILLAGRAAGQSDEIIRERMRETYV